MSMNSLEEAIDLVKKATEAFNEQRYEEALLQYELAISYFLLTLKDESHEERPQESMHAKCAQYLEEQMRNYLTEKSKVDTGGDGGGGGEKRGKRARRGGGHAEVGATAIEIATDLVKKVTKAGSEQNYEKAVQQYELAIMYFLQAVKYEAHGESSQESMRTKCDQYLELAEQLKNYLTKKSKAACGGSCGNGGGGGAKAGEVEKGRLRGGGGYLLTTSHLEKAIDLVKKATEADNEQKYKEALQLYEHAIDYFLHALKYEARGERSRESIRAKCAQYLERAEQLKRYLIKKSKVASGGGGRGGRGNVWSGRDRSNDDDNSITGSIQSEPLPITFLLKLHGRKSTSVGAIVSEKPNVHWDDIAGLQVAKANLAEAAIFPIKFPHLFQTKYRKPWKGILLYGPRGTGKTYLSKAVATEAESTFFSVNLADLFSMQPGESERLVRGLFDLARNNKPAIIFIDEVDSLCSMRWTCSTWSRIEPINPIKTELLDQMQGVGVDNDGILVLGATNKPWELNTTILKMFEKRIYIPLPEENTRYRLLQIHLGTICTTLTESDYKELARMTDGYSAADIGVLVREAVMMPIRKIQTATHFKQTTGPSPNDPSIIRSDLLVPCGPCEAGAQEMNMMNIPGDRLMEPPVTMDDFLKAASFTRPSVNSADLKQFKDWGRDFCQ